MWSLSPCWEIPPKGGVSEIARGTKVSLDWSEGNGQGARSPVQKQEPAGKGKVEAQVLRLNEANFQKVLVVERACSSQWWPPWGDGWAWPWQQGKGHRYLSLLSPFPQSAGSLLPATLWGGCYMVTSSLQMRSVRQEGSRVWTWNGEEPLYSITSSSPKGCGLEA